MVPCPVRFTPFPMGTLGMVLVSITLVSVSLAGCLRPPVKTNVVAAASAPGAVAAPESAAPPKAVRTPPGFPPTVEWTTGAPVIVPKPDAKHALVAVKDPTIVRFKDRWHVYASSVSKGGIYGMVYTSFAEWKDAAQAPFYFMDNTPGFDTYVAAPQLFYFAPEEIWYLVFQSGPPMFSRNKDPGDPTQWTEPQPFYPRPPAFIEQTGGWLDFWVICDTAYCHMFFSNDHGRFYKSKTPIDRFPRGFDTPVVVMEEKEAGRLFEACNVYKVAGGNRYLALVEAFDASSNHRRYFRSFTAESLEGPWTVWHDDGSAPFAGIRNVRFEGAKWTEDVSHGELIRAGYDQTLTIDPGAWRFLFQAFDPKKNSSDYNSIPWNLGLLTLE